MRRATAHVTLPALSAKVTGSNGKGSTSHLIALGLAAHGLRVGLYTSPHFLDPSERIQVLSAQGRVPIDDATLWSLVGEAAGEARTRFEALTIAAARYFARQSLDAVVWEAGIGGRNDATRGFEAPVTVLTQVALEHTAVLGNTLEAITADKAELTSPGQSLVLGPLAPALIHIARSTLAARGGPQSAVQVVEEAVTTGLVGAHQGWNAACASAALQRLLGATYQAQLTSDAFAGAHVPGRFERVRAGELPVWVDAAHEQSGLNAALAAAHKRFGPRWLLVFGVSADRDVEQMAAVALAQVPRASDGSPQVVVTTAHHKGAPLDRVVRAFGVPVCAAKTPADALVVATERARVDGDAPSAILATGGLFLAAEVAAECSGRPGGDLQWF